MTEVDGQGLTRRRLLVAGGGALGLAAAAGAGYAAGDAAADGRAPRGEEIVPFEGRRQAGVATPAQARLDVPDLDARGADGAPVIPLDAHIRLAALRENGGATILRRGYAYTDGIDPRTGLLDAGLFFISFQRDPATQFAAIQRKLGTRDALTEYIQHTGSGLFAVPPGARAGGYVGAGLLG